LRAPLFRGFSLLPGELAVDNFAGGGGASTGIEAALGRPVDIAINHSPEAIAMHKANHPETRHFCEDIWAVDPREAAAGRPVGLAWFSPDCFPAGTMVLTRDGYRPIEQLEVGDEVLTHECRWRAVTATMTSVKPLLRLRGHGHPGLLVSPEHPFWTRQRTDGYAKGKVTRYFAPPLWTPASEIGRGAYWGTPIVFPSEQPPAIPVVHKRETAVNAEIMWLAGRYIADGWTRLTPTRADLVITCGRHEVDGLRQRLSVWPRIGARAVSNEIAWQERETGTAYQFTCSHLGLVVWLREHFGHGAAEKLIPGWALGMHEEFRRALLDGYLSGDGWRGTNTGSAVTEAFTVSKALAFGLKALAASLGKTVTVATGANRDTIEGRKVNARPYWQLRWRDDVDPGHRQTFRDSDVEWTPVREIEAASDGETVYNLSVAEDESYVVDGIIVHNCTHFSRAKGGQPRQKEIRGLAWVVINWAKTVAPRVILLENVEEFETWGPLDDEGQPIKERIGETFRAWLAELTSCGYSVEFESLVAADYGTPTTRRRLFMVARRDGRGIVWPKPTHGDGRAERWRPAAEIIDWSLPCPSIFDRDRPLADATMRRIAAGIQRYVVGARQPFVMPLTHHQGGARGRGIDEPLATVTGAHRGELAVVEPFIVRHGHVSRDGVGNTMRGQRLNRPLATVCATNDKHLIAPIITKHYGGPRGHQTPGQDIRRPLGTVTESDHHALSAAFLMKYHGTFRGQGIDRPLLTVDTRDRFAEVRAFLTKFYGTSTGSSVQLPLPTVTSGGERGDGHLGLVIIEGEPYEIADIGMRMLQPHELFAAQGFPDHYDIAPTFNGKPLTKTAQTALAGNSVCPQVAEALVLANAGAREAA
jgi:site-specific DNA-cytosine methylase